MLETSKIGKRCATAYLFFVFSVAVLCGQSVVQHSRIVFYNCENLFEPSDNPEKLDDEFTPDGERHWTYTRVNQKVTNLARVLVAAGEGRAPMLVGLAEVENDSVLMRLTRRTALREWEYDFVVTQSPDTRGINVALLYQPMDFRLLGWMAVRVPMPDGARPTRDLLHAWGRVVGGDTLDVIVCHLPSRLGGVKRSTANRQAAHRVIRQLSDSLHRHRACPHVIVMGDMNDYPDTRLLRKDMAFGQCLTNLMEPLQRDLKRGRLACGSHKYGGEWGFLDQFWVSNGLVEEMPLANAPKSRLWLSNAEAFHLPFMLTDDVTHMGHRPLRSYNGFQYEGGYSDHLPIRLELHIEYVP